MKIQLYTLFLTVIIFSCEKYPEPNSQVVEQFSVYLIGNFQSAEGDEYLPDEVGAQINVKSLHPLGDLQFRMEVEVLSGNGTVNNEIIYADENGKMTTRWKLGDTANDQFLTCRIFDSNNKEYSEFQIEATAFFRDKLNIIKKGDLVGISDMVRDTINQRSMLLSGGDVFISTDTFYRWLPLDEYHFATIKEIEINSRGDIYAAAWNGDLYKTSDWGTNWIQLGKPIPDNKYHYELTITKDDYIWANKWEYGIYCSMDDGLTWHKDTFGLTKQEELGRVFLFEDTCHMAISYANLTIHKTVDNGLTWEQINTPEYSLSMFITEDDAIIAQNQNGFNLHKSIDGGKTYRSVFAASVAFGTSSKHCYDMFNNNYYVLAPGGGVWKTKDFEDFEELMRFTQQRRLFIDHTGTLYATGFKYVNAEDQPTYVLPASAVVN